MLGINYSSSMITSVRGAPINLVRSDTTENCPKILFGWCSCIFRVVLIKTAETNNHYGL